MAGVEANQGRIADESATQPNGAPGANVDRRNRLYHFLQLCLRAVVPVYFRYRARGVEHVPEHGAALLVVNHQSFLDPLFVGIPISRPVRFLARDSLYKGPLIGGFLKKIYTIPLSREAASSATIRQTVAQLQQGFVVGIFPEGTRSTDGQIASLKPGFIALVRRANVPIVPVGIAGTGAAFPRGAWFIRPKKCRVVFGPPLLPELLAPHKEHGSEQSFLDLVHEAMTRCYEEAREWQSR